MYIFRIGILNYVFITIETNKKHYNKYYFKKIMEIL